MKDYFSKLFSQRGMSLMEITVATGLLGVLLTGVTTVTVNMQKSSKKTEQDFEISALHNEIIGFLANGDNCYENFENKDPADPTVSLSTLVKSGGGPKYNTGTSYNGVKIDSMDFGGGSSPVAGSLTFVVTKLKICFKRQGSDNAICPKKDGIPITVKLSGGKIVSCSAVASGTGLWGEVADGIHYQGGNVGVGVTSSPNFPLEVNGEIRASTFGDGTASITAGNITGAQNISASSSIQLGGIGVATVNMIWGSLDNAQRDVIIGKLSSSSNEKVVADAVVMMALNSLSIDSSPCESGQKVTGVSYNPPPVSTFTFACENEDDPCIPFGGTKIGDICDKIDLADIKKGGIDVATVDQLFNQLSDQQKEEILQAIVSSTSNQVGVNAIASFAINKLSVEGEAPCPTDERVANISYNNNSGTFTITCSPDRIIADKSCTAEGEAIREIKDGVAICGQVVTKTTSCQTVTVDASGNCPSNLPDPSGSTITNSDCNNTTACSCPDGTTQASRWISGKTWWWGSWSCGNASCGSNGCKDCSTSTGSEAKCYSLSCCTYTYSRNCCQTIITLN